MIAEMGVASHFFLLNPSCRSPERAGKGSEDLVERQINADL